MNKKHSVFIFLRENGSTEFDNFLQGDRYVFRMPGIFLDFFLRSGGQSAPQNPPFFLTVKGTVPQPTVFITSKFYCWCIFIKYVQLTYSQNG